jgi:ATP-dependent protease ClpP protease subunit
MSFNWSIKKRKLNKEENQEEDSDFDTNIFTKLLKPKGTMKAVTRINNDIYFYGSVNNTNVLDLIHTIKECNEELTDIATKYNIKSPEIYLHLNTYGGSLFAGFAAMDAIKDNPIPVVTIIEGCVASAGTLMSICGSKRYMRKNSYMLIHQLSGGLWGKMEEMEDDMLNNKELMKRIKDIYQEFTKVPKTKLADILKHDIWWNSEVCQQYGLVDEIIDGTKFNKKLI